MDLPEKEKINFKSPFVTLDGYVFDEQFSYDNDHDETLPTILTGVKNPNSKERMKNIRHRRSFPKSLLPKRKLKWTEWYQGNNNLSEILSKYPHLSAGIVIGQKSAYDILCLIIELNWEYLPHNLPFYEDLLHVAQRRCRANNYQGKWNLLSKILQVVSNKTALLGFIRENFHSRELYGNIIPHGRRQLETIYVHISLFPVNYPQRQRGYKDKGSQKALHEIHDLSVSCSTKRLTRENLLTTSKQSVVNFLYGSSTPVWIGGESESESNYRKIINRQNNQQRKQERDRIKSLSSPVRTYTLSEAERAKYK